MRQWKKTIKSLGFSDSEAQLYLSALELGPSPVQTLAKRADVSRVTAYASIEALMKIGLMSTVEKGKKKLFASESPEKLVSVAQAKAKEIESKAKEVESYIDELKLMERGEKPVVKVFEGPEALEVVKRDILETNADELYELENLDDFDNLYTLKESDEYYRNLAKLRTKRTLFFASEKTQPTGIGGNEEIYHHNKQGKFHGDITVYGNKVMLSSYQGKQIAVIIESAAIADAMKELFMIAKGGKEYKRVK